jgi:hypothetical protein
VGEGRGSALDARIPLYHLARTEVCLAIQRGPFGLGITER